MSEYYNDKFYETISDWSYQSAKVLIPYLTEFINFSSVIDVGCGDGTWLSQFQHYGAKRILGLDGSYINKEILKIDQENFLPCDLENPPIINESFDIAVCLEVVEHLSEVAGKQIIYMLTQVSNFVLFSAAIPNQIGINHKNNQWQDYWASLFLIHDYLPITTIRSNVWNNPKVEFFYKQNIVLYVKKEISEKSPVLLNAIEDSRIIPMSVVHPEYYTKFVQLLLKKTTRRDETFRDALLYHIKRRLVHIRKNLING